MIVFFRTLIVLTFTCEHLLVAHVQISIRSIETWPFFIKIQFSLQHDLADCMYLNVCVQWFVMCC